MTTQVTTDCIACGRCAEICPDVFEMGDEIARAADGHVVSEHEEAVREAASECPTNAILIEE